MGGDKLVDVMTCVSVGNVAKSVGGALAEHFFGPNGDQKLTLERFQKFHSQLCTEILEMEVYTRDTTLVLDMIKITCYVHLYMYSAQHDFSEMFFFS